MTNPEPQLARLMEHLQQAKLDFLTVEKDYEGKKKGTIYISRRESALEKVEHYERRISRLGTAISLVVVNGKRRVKVTDNLERTESFKTYYTDIHPEDALAIAKNSIEGYIEAEANQIRALGVPIPFDRI